MKSNSEPLKKAYRMENNMPKDNEGRIFLLVFLIMPLRAMAIIYLLQKK